MKNADRPLQIIGLAASPRRQGNTDRLLDAFLAGAAEKQAQVEKIRLAELEMRPCIDCRDCFQTGACRFPDDASTLVLPRLQVADIVVFATPVYFHAVPAQAKLLIDRTQVLWAQREILRQEPPADRPATWGVLLAAGARDERTMFDGLRLTVKYWMKSFHAELMAERLYRRLDDRDAATKHPTALAEVRELGRQCTAARLADPNSFV